MSSLPIKASVTDKLARAIDGASRLAEHFVDCCYFTELALVVSRTEAAVTDKLEDASPIASGGGSK